MTDHFGIADSPEALVVRFAIAEKTPSAKSPTHRAFVSLPAPLDGMCIDLPIFGGQQGNDPSIAYPSVYGNKAVQVEPELIERKDGTFVPAGWKNPKGVETSDRLLLLVKQLFLDWRLAPVKPTTQVLHL